LILGHEEALESAEAAGLAGVAYGLAGIMRSLPRHRAMARCYVPLDLLEQHGASAADVITHESEPSLNIVLSELRKKIRLRMEQARELTWTIKPVVMPAFLHMSLTEAYLKKLDGVLGNVLETGAEIAFWRKQWVLWKAAKAESF
jgi:15-cis-phytoene synthase